MTTPHTPPTQAELDALKKLCENASPDWSEDGEDECVVTGNPCDPNARTVPINWDDCLFMVAARTALPAFISEITRLTKEVEELRKDKDQLDWLERCNATLYLTNACQAKFVELHRTGKDPLTGSMLRVVTAAAMQQKGEE